jgi:hypothetical protein
MAGRPLPEVAALAGHRDIKMTMRYAHLTPSHPARTGYTSHPSPTVHCSDSRLRPGSTAAPRHPIALSSRVGCLTV